MAETNIPHCMYCGKQIKWSGKFGWYHGVMGVGWNTSCEDDANLAEPTDKWYQQELKDYYDSDVPYPKETSPVNEKIALYQWQFDEIEALIRHSPGGLEFLDRSFTIKPSPNAHT